MSIETKTEGYNLRVRSNNNENISKAESLLSKQCCACNSCKNTAIKTSLVKIPKQKNLTQNSASDSLNCKELSKELKKIEKEAELSDSYVSDNDSDTFDSELWNSTLSDSSDIYENNDVDLSEVQIEALIEDSLREEDVSTKKEEKISTRDDSEKTRINNMLNHLRSTTLRNNTNRLQNIGMERQKIEKMNTYISEHNIGARKQ